MLFSIVSVLVATVTYSQSATVDQSQLDEIFGTLPPTTSPANSSHRLEDITVQPTQSRTSFANSDGEQCQCLPYYLCDTNNVSLYLDPKINRYGILNIRYGGEEECPESIERCCSPLPEPQLESVTPEPTTLRGCGYRNPKGQDFTITGGYGDEAQFGEFPWVVALLDATKDLTYVGVGVLIHPQVVMTGAYIAYKYASGTLVARAGEWDTQTNKARLKAQERIVQDIVIREDFHPKTLRNDIALLRLQEPVDLMDHINVICLPRQDEDFDNYRDCVSNGWGKENFGLKNRYAVILRKIELNMVPFNQCESLLKKTRLGYRFKLHKSFICAGGVEGQDTCSGDGGAPLVCPTGRVNRYKLSGLVAWGIRCWEKDFPAVFARVSMFRNWIDNIMLSWGYSTDGYTLYDE